MSSHWNYTEPPAGQRQITIKAALLSSCASHTSSNFLKQSFVLRVSNIRSAGVGVNWFRRGTA